MTPSIKQALDSTVIELTQSDSPRLDAELLLSHVLDVDRSYLFTYPERELTETEHHCFKSLIARRAQSEPVAYLIGKKSFWDLELIVTPAVLVPRPETELLVEAALELGAADRPLNLADLGTGSGAIALALAKSRPGWQVLAVDVSPEALAVARQNAENIKVDNLDFSQGSWCAPLQSKSFDLIISNPPYVAPGDPHLQDGDLPFEPKLALQADDEGFAAFHAIAKSARDCLVPGGWLLLEHGYDQQDQLKSILREYGYQEITGRADLAGSDRIVIARWQEPVSDLSGSRG